MKRINHGVRKSGETTYKGVAIKRNPITGSVSASIENKPTLKANSLDKLKQMIDASLIESSSSVTSLNHGDIVTIRGPIRRNGFFRVDTEEALGASSERPWVGDLQDGLGHYIDPSDVQYLTVILDANEFDTRGFSSNQEVEDYLDDLDEDVSSDVIVQRLLEDA